MKSRNKIILTASASIILSLICISYAVSVFSQTQNSATDKEKTTRVTQTQILKDPIWFQPVSLTQLRAESNLIVVGVPVQNKSITIGESRVVTQYMFRVDEIIKGDIQTGIGIKIDFPGGMIRNSDNTMLHVATPGFRKMKNNSNYLLFLKSADQALTPNRGPQGVFELENNSVISYGTMANEDYKVGQENINAINFFREVRKSGKESSNKN